jgi:hypothetical protein
MNSTRNESGQNSGIESKSKKKDSNLWQNQPKENVDNWCSNKLMRNYKEELLNLRYKVGEHSKITRKELKDSHKFDLDQYKIKSLNDQTVFSLQSDGSKKLVAKFV